ncbi:MAG: efflux RND transporter periplasmic adaptor subunit [Sulfurospirillaceae bacterium]|nr:efflux RND transporter periplasmic adaptor subunit [Sulfurospirillaceae bacterium]
MLNVVKKYIGFVIVFLLLVVSAYFIYVKINPKKLPENLIASSGRIDGDLILLNTKYPARVSKIYVKEGDSIRVGEDIAKLRSKELYNKKSSIEEAILSLRKERLSFLQSIDSQQLSLKLLEKTLPKLVAIKTENLKNLKNRLASFNLQISKLNLGFEQDKKDYKRYRKLYASKMISDERFELQELKYKTTANELKTLKIGREKILNDINIAQSLLEIEQDNLEKINISKQNITVSQTKYSSLGNKISQLAASKDEVQAMIDELTIKSPVNGFVVEKIANEGEVVGAGSVVVTVSDTNSYYLKLFIDTMDNGRIKLGDKAVIFLDAYPNKPIPATVTAIAAKAEFTPKDVSVRSDRIQRVYAIHVRPLKYNPILKLGIPAIGVVSIDGAILPKSLNDIPKI